MTTQYDLFAPISRKLTEKDTVRLVKTLEDLLIWIKAIELIRITGYSDRSLRFLANASDGRIITGQKGYRAASRATEDERLHAAAWLESQASHMVCRALKIRTNSRRLAA